MLKIKTLLSLRLAPVETRLVQGSAAAVWTCDFQQHNPAVLYMYLKINSSSKPTSVFFFFFVPVELLCDVFRPIAVQ